MGSSDSAPDPPVQKLPVQEGTVPEYLASIHKLFYSVPVIGEDIKLGLMNRVAPGQLKMKKPDSVVTLYNQFVEIFNYTDNQGFTDPMVYQFMLMLFCTAWKVWDDVPEYGRLYCYDNAWADSLLNNGNKPKGIFGWADVFTWTGFAQVEMFMVVMEMLWQFVLETTYATMFIGFYLSNTNMVWCFPGEEIDIFFGLVNGCEIFGYQLM